MKIFLVVLGILLLAGLMFAGKFVSVRNDLAVQNEAIAGAWSQVDVALQRRADLIPNLVNTVKGFATHEQQVIDSTVQCRSAHHSDTHGNSGPAMMGLGPSTPMKER